MAMTVESTVLLLDNFNTSDTTNLDTDIAIRQIGSSLVSPVSYITRSSNAGGIAQIPNNSLDMFDDGGPVALSFSTTLWVKKLPTRAASPCALQLRPRNSCLVMKMLPGLL